MMKKMILWLQVFVSGLLFSANIAIIMPDNASVQEKHATKELIEHLQMAGHRVETGQPDTATDEWLLLHVGKSKLAAQMNVNLAGFSAEEWLIQAYDAKNCLIAGGEPRGTVYAALEFLERFAGVIWMDEWSTHVPVRQPLKWDPALKLRGQPAIEWRCIHAYFKAPHHGRVKFMARNRQNFFHEENNLPGIADFGITRLIGLPRSCHTFYNYSKDWSEVDEDCFSLSASGQRLRATSSSGPGQVCLTNPRTRKLFTEKLRFFIAKDRANVAAGSWPVLYDISANDNNSKCECSACTAAAEKYQSYGGVVLEFINAIAREIADEYPEVKLQTFAYMFAQWAPQGIKAEPNVIVRLAQLGTEWGIGNRDSLRSLTHPNNLESLTQLKAWSKLSTVSMWDYWVMFCRKGNPPSVNLLAIAENLRIYAEHGVWFVFAQCEAPLATSFFPLRLWLGFRMMNLPQLDAVSEIKRYMAAYYGDAAGFLYDYLQLLQKANDSVAEPLEDLPVLLRYDLSKDFFQRSDELLTAAEAAVAGNGKLLWRISCERVILDKAWLDINKSRGWLTSGEKLKLMDRYQKNHQAVAEVYLPVADALAANTRLQIYLRGLQLEISPLPYFAGMDVLGDYCWPDFNQLSSSELVDAADAFGGRALTLGNSVSHDWDLQFGYYDVEGKKFKINVNIPKECLPQDEKFHLYPLGKTELTSKSFFWAHRSWHIQREMHELYDTSGLNNAVEIFASLKVQGSAYVKGSERENAVMLDRLLVIRVPASGSAGSGVPLPASVARNRLAYDFSWHSFIPHSLYDKKVASLERDKDSIGGCAIKIHLPEAWDGLLHWGVQDIKGSLDIRRQETLTAVDSAYKLYSLGVLEITPAAQLWVQDSSIWRLSLASCFHSGGDNRYEVLVSLKMAAPETQTDRPVLMLDRILLLKPEP